jgi:hypothetical protein
MVKNGCDLVIIYLKLWPGENFVILRKNTGIKDSVSSPDKTMRTISMQGPNGDKSPATRTLVSRTMIILHAFCEQLWSQH